MTIESVDWNHVCDRHRITPQQLKAIAAELGLPMARLNTPQTAQLYHRVLSLYPAGEDGGQLGLDF